MPAGAEDIGRDVPAARHSGAGYGAIWHGQKGFNGVAILAKGAEPIESRRGLPNDPDDTHSRYLEASVNGIIVGSIYLPNGNPQPGPKFDYKLAWFQRLIDHAAQLYDCGSDVVLVGDYNVVPTDNVYDIYSPRSYLDDALLQPETRAAWRRLLAQGWTDAIHTLHPERGDVHVLGLLQKPVAARCRASDRPFVAECERCSAAERGGRGQSDARQGEAKRSRACLGRPGVGSGERFRASCATNTRMYGRSKNDFQNEVRIRRNRIECDCASASYAGEFNESNGVAIKGYDPVAFFKESKPVRGKDDLRFEYKGSTFVFANADNRAAFAADPEKYAPQYGGYCAFGTARGYKADIDPATFTVIDGRLYLNYNAQVQK